MEGVNRDTFIEENMGLVGMVMKKYIHRIAEHPYIDRDDLISIGVIGLIKAYDRFDSSFGTQFSTYAVPMIDGEIRRYLRDDLDTVKFSRRIKSDYYKIVKGGLLNESPGVISVMLKIPIDQVEDALAYYRGQYTDSLERPVFEDEGNILSLGDMIGDETDFDSNLEIQDFLKQFDGRTQEIIKLRLQNLKQKEIGDIVGISQVQISRILLAARKKLERGGVKMSENKKRDFALAKKLAIETELNGYAISKQSGVSPVTAYKYISDYRVAKEEIQEVERRIKGQDTPVKTYILSPEELEKYREGGPVAKAIKDKPEREITMHHAVTNKTMEKTTDSDTKIENRLDIPEEVINKPQINSADGFMTMTFNLTVENATSQLEDIIKAMKVLGFKDLNLTIQSQQVA